MIRGTPYAHARGIAEILKREAKLIERLTANMPKREPESGHAARELNFPSVEGS